METNRLINQQQQQEQRDRLIQAVLNNRQDQRDKLLQLSDSVRVAHQTKHFVQRQREEGARILENRTKAHLNRIVLKIVDENHSDISLIQRKFSMEVEHTIRSAVTYAWLLTIDYVGASKKKSHQMFVTSSDVDKMKQLTAEFCQIFWRRVSVVLHQKDIIPDLIKSARFSPRSSLTLSSLVTSLATRIVTKTLSIATVAKVNALRHVEEPATSIKSAQAAADILQWVSAEDSRVCAYCADLNGRQWAADDPSLLTPGSDSHDNCRCVLNIVTPEGETVPSGGLY